jgi:hypothetical protein
MPSKTRVFCDVFVVSCSYLSVCASIPHWLICINESAARIYIWNAWLFSSMLSSYLAYHQLFIITLAVREVDLHAPFRICYVPHSVCLIWLILTCYSGCRCRRPFLCVQHSVYTGAPEMIAVHKSLVHVILWYPIL